MNNSINTIFYFAPNAEEYNKVKANINSRTISFVPNGDGTGTIYKAGVKYSGSNYNVDPTSTPSSITESWIEAHFAGKEKTEGDITSLNDRLSEFAQQLITMSQNISKIDYSINVTSSQTTSGYNIKQNLPNGGSKSFDINIPSDQYIRNIVLGLIPTETNLDSVNAAIAQLQSKITALETCCAQVQSRLRVLEEDETTYVTVSLSLGTGATATNPLSTTSVESGSNYSNTFSLQTGYENLSVVATSNSVEVFNQTSSNGSITMNLTGITDDVNIVVTCSEIQQVQQTQRLSFSLSEQQTEKNLVVDSTGGTYTISLYRNNQSVTMSNVIDTPVTPSGISVNTYTNQITIGQNQSSSSNNRDITFRVKSTIAEDANEYVVLHVLQSGQTAAPVVVNNLSLGSQSTTLDYQAGELQLPSATFNGQNITLNASNIYTLPQWMSVSNNKIYYTENTGTESRSAVLSIIYGGETVGYTVTQSPEGSRVLSFDSAGTQFSKNVTVNANSDKYLVGSGSYGGYNMTELITLYYNGQKLTASLDQFSNKLHITPADSWATGYWVEGTRGNINQLKVGGNPYETKTSDRQTTITVSYHNSNSITINLTQKACLPTFSNEVIDCECNVIGNPTGTHTLEGIYAFVPGTDYSKYQHPYTRRDPKLNVTVFFGIEEIRSDELAVITNDSNVTCPSWIEKGKTSDIEGQGSTVSNWVMTYTKYGRQYATLLFDVTPNTTGSTRVGNIVIDGGDGSHLTIRVTQKATYGVNGHNQFTDGSTTIGTFLDPYEMFESVDWYIPSDTTLTQYADDTDHFTVVMNPVDSDFYCIAHTSTERQGFNFGDITYNYDSSKSGYQQWIWPSTSN